jgi:acyl-CoA dehydrogenase
MSVKDVFKLDGQVALVTGASRGLGLQMAKALGEMGCRGGSSVSDDFGLARAYASTRTLRFADGPDEVHRNAIAEVELARYADEQ